MIKKSCHFLFIFFLILTFKVYAQDPLLKHFTTNDGLPSSTIYALLQDKDGFIWFGTDVGVSRFDGKKFQNFSLSDGLSDNYIISVRADSKGRIWFLGFNGTVSYWLNGKIVNAGSDTLLRNIVTTTSFIDFFEDNENRLWFISQNEYVILENSKIVKPDSNLLLSSGIVLNGRSGQIVLNQTKAFVSQHGSLSLSRQPFRFYTKSNGGYWRGPDGSIMFISKEGVVHQMDTSQKLIVPFNKEFVNSQQPGIILSYDSMFWISTTGKGVYCYDYKNPNAKPLIYLKNKLTAALLADKEGNIWISTLNDGLYMIPEWGRKVRVFNKDNGMLDNHCYSLHLLNSGELLVGMNKGKTESIFNNKIAAYETLTIDEEPNKVHHLLVKGDDVWIASDKGLIHQNKKKGCNHFLNFKTNDTGELRKISSIKDMTWGKNELFIISGFNILSFPIECNGKQYSNLNYVNERQTRTYSIYCDYNGELWYGTKSGLQSKKGSVFYDHSNENTLLTKGINAIAETPDSILVLATYGYGILLYKNGKIIQQITTESGLRNNICRRVFIHKNNIFVATPSGVSVINYTPGGNASVLNLNTGNFLPSNDVNDVFVNDSSIYIATMEGVAILGHWSLTKIKLDLPLLFITEIKVNDSMVFASNRNEFSYHQNSFKFNYIGIYYQTPDEVNYRYKLKNDQPWQYTKNTALEFSFLSAGSYNFQLQARILNGEWCQVKNYAFKITPPFWNEIWFLILLSFTLGFLITFLIRRRVQMLKKRKDEKAKLEKQITQLEQQALQTLMNPHFIFNVMNSIQHFINANDKDAANRYLADFAKLIRMNLTISLKRYIPLEEEIKYLQLYLSFEKLRFGDNLTYEIVVDPQIDTSETTIAVMMIQPFIENAIWHGILPMKSKGHIRIYLSKETEDLVKVIIEDNGVGINEALIDKYTVNELNESHALNITLQRLHLLGKSSGHNLYIHYSHVHPELENKGTIAELLLPANFY